MSSSLPLVSVIIPTYNHEQFLVKAIQSDVEKPFNSIEILIINDGLKINYSESYFSHKQQEPSYLKVYN
ncbi:MAG: glycosyltransferase [Lutibacter sp.]